MAMGGGRNEGKRKKKKKKKRWAGGGGLGRRRKYRRGMEMEEINVSTVCYPAKNGRHRLIESFSGWEIRRVVQRMRRGMEGMFLKSINGLSLLHQSSFIE